MKQLTISLTLALCLGLQACSTPKLFKSNKKTLESALASMEEGDLERSLLLGDSLVFKTTEEAREYQLQRFFAAYLGAQAHLRASFGAEFLMDPKSTRRRGIAGSTNAQTPSPIAHMLATTRAASYGIDWAPASASDADLAAQVPAALAELGIDNATTNLRIVLLTIYSRLGFENRLKSILSDSPELLKLDACRGFIEKAGLHEEARPWVMYLVFNYLRDKDEPMAFRFAAEALFNDLGKGPDQDMENWITTESSYKFSCPEGEHEADPRTRTCFDGVFLGNFESQVK